MSKSTCRRRNDKPDKPYHEFLLLAHVHSQMGLRQKHASPEMVVQESSFHENSARLQFVEERSFARHYGADHSPLRSERD